jgi:hypothetical protein
MKSFFTSSLPVMIYLLTSCSPFPTSYSRIEEDKTRLLDFIYEPAEAAPGDTVTLTAVFAGKVITADELTWRISQQMIVNEYGAQTALDTTDLDMIPRDFSFSENTSTVSFLFVIPTDVLKKSPIIPDRWIERLPAYFRDAVPEPYRSMTKTEILTLVDNLSDPSTGAWQDIDETALLALPALLQCFTAPIRLFCTYENGHKIYSDYTVRYNSRFAAIPQMGIPYNRNPSIDSIGLYVVDQAPITVFDPEDTDHEFTYRTLDDSIEITVEEGKSYFLQVNTGNMDTTLSIEASLGISDPLPELHFTEWYFEFDQEEIEGVAPGKLFNIEAGNLLVQLYPPKKDAALTALVWLEVTDMFLNELFRPQGSMLKELYFEFRYD